MKNMKLKLSILALSLSTIGIANAGILDKLMEKITPPAITPPWIDPNNEYIIRPDLPMYKEFEWTTWRDSAGGRLAHDPKWFILPPDKYIPKEAPFNWDSVKGQTALQKRNTYYSHLCKTEAVGYITSEYPQDISKDSFRATSTWFYPRFNPAPVKDMGKILKNEPEKFKKIFKIANQNPYINPNYGYHDWNENMTLRADLRKATEEFYKRNPGLPQENTFREYMLDDSRIYRSSFDAKSNRYLPLKKVDKPEARYYNIWREIERPEMKKLGIYGQEWISVDRNSGKLISYRKHFQIPLYMDSLRASGQEIPIDWHRSSICAEKARLIETFN